MISILRPTARRHTYGFKFGVPTQGFDTLSATRPREVCSQLLTVGYPFGTRLASHEGTPPFFLQTFCCAQISLGLLVATNTANIVAVLRILPAIVVSAFDTGSCCSASPSRRVLTLWSWSTSFRIASKTMGYTALSPESLRGGGLQMDWLRSEDLKEEKVVTTSLIIIAVHRGSLIQIDL